MSERADLTGQQIGEWKISHKATAQNRRPFWTVAHSCGVAVDLAHTLLVPLLKGKVPTLPPCTSCTPAAELPAISLGMHLSCGQAHLVGTACAPAKMLTGAALALTGAYVDGAITAAARFNDLGQRVHGDDDPIVVGRALGAPKTGGEVPDAGNNLPADSLDLDALAGWDDEGPRVLDLDALDAEPLPPVLHLDLGSFAVDPEFGLPRPADYPDPFDFTLPTPVVRHAWALTDAKAPEPTLNRAFRDVLLAPMYAAMAGNERNHQVKPGPSGVGGCRRKLAHQLLYADEFVAEPSGWASMKGTVLHAWYDSLVRQPGWFSDLALPATVESVTGGKLDLYISPARTVVDLKFPGTTQYKEARAGRLSNAYYVQLMTYGLGLEQLGMPVETVGLLVVPMCGDDLDAAIYWEWPYDRTVAGAALAEAERIAADPRPRAEVLASMPTKNDFCSSCPAFGKHCQGAMPAVEAPAPRGGLELVR